MLKLYTCYCCGFPFKSDDQELPTECPACGANPDNFLVEPYNEQEIRRIHVDPPLPDPNRDPYNLGWHMPKDFPPRSRNGRLRRFVLEYDKPEQLNFLSGSVRLGYYQYRRGRGRVSVNVLCNGAGQL